MQKLDLLEEVIDEERKADEMMSQNATPGLQRDSSQISSITRKTGRLVPSLSLMMGNPEQEYINKSIFSNDLCTIIKLSS